MTANTMTAPQQGFVEGMLREIFAGEPDGTAMRCSPGTSPRTVRGPGRNQGQH